MARYAALVRALNVGGTGKLTMPTLIACCEQAGFEEVKTYIASGNVVFNCALNEAKAKATLEKALEKKMGATVDVFVRTHHELTAIVNKNPFKKAPSNQVIVFFLDEPAGKDELSSGPDGEEMRAHGREVFVHYPVGQGRSKLKVAFAKRATGRNLNTIQKLTSLTA